MTMKSIRIIVIRRIPGSRRQNVSYHPNDHCLSMTHTERNPQSLNDVYSREQKERMPRIHPIPEPNRTEKKRKEKKGMLL